MPSKSKSSRSSRSLQDSEVDLSSSSKPLVSQYMDKSNIDEQNKGLNSMRKKKTNSIEDSQWKTTPIKSIINGNKNPTKTQNVKYSTLTQRQPQTLKKQSNVKPHTAPETIMVTTDPKTSKHVENKKGKSKDAIIQTEPNFNLQPPQSLYFRAISRQGNSKLFPQQQFEKRNWPWQNYDNEMFLDKRDRSVKLLKNYILKTDIDLDLDDLDDLEIIDEKFLSSIDITGYVDEVFN